MILDAIVIAFLLGMLAATGLIETICHFDAVNRARAAARRDRPSSLPSPRLERRR